MEEQTYLMEELPSGKWTVAAAFSVEYALGTWEWQIWLELNNWN